MEFFIHHNVTVILMMLSWSVNVVRIGTLVLCIHDPVDYILAVSNRIVYRVKVRVVKLSWSVNVECIAMLVLCIHDPVDYILAVSNRIVYRVIGFTKLHMDLVILVKKRRSSLIF